MSQLAVLTQPEIGKEEETPRQLYDHIMGFLRPEITKAYVVGKFCSHANSHKIVCPGVDANCLESKRENCVLSRKYNRVRKATEYFISKIKELRDEGKDVSQLVYYLKLARERLEQFKFLNARVYHGIIKRKLNDKFNGELK